MVGMLVRHAVGHQIAISLPSYAVRAFTVEL